MRSSRSNGYGTPSAWPERVIFGAEDAILGRCGAVRRIVCLRGHRAYVTVAGLNRWMGMARRQLLQRLAGRMAAEDQIAVVLDDAQAAISVHDRPSMPSLEVPADLPVPDGMDVEEYRACLAALADRVCRSLSRTHHVDHVSLWRFEGSGFAMVGASGLTSMWRTHVIPRNHGAVRLAMLGDGILVEESGGRDSHVLDLPAHNTSTYGIAILREGPLVDLLTAGGDNLNDDAMFAMAQFAADEAALWERARRREHLEVLIGEE